MVGGGEKTFLVESYVPQLDERTAAAISSRLRAAARQLRQEGLALKWVRSFALLEEETYLCIVAAHALDHAVRLTERAGVASDHAVEVVAIEPSRIGTG